MLFFQVRKTDRHILLIPDWEMTEGLRKAAGLLDIRSKTKAVCLEKSNRRSRLIICKLKNMELWSYFQHPTCFLLAGGADKAAGVVGLAQGRHHLPLDEVLATEAASPIQPLVVQGTDVFPLTHKETSLGQFASTYCDKKGRGKGREQGQRGTGSRMGSRKGWGRRGWEKRDSLDTWSHCMNPAIHATWMADLTPKLLAKLWHISERETSHLFSPVLDKHPHLRPAIHVTINNCHRITPPVFPQQACHFWNSSVTPSVDQRRQHKRIFIQWNRSRQTDRLERLKVRSTVLIVNLERFQVYSLYLQFTAIYRHSFEKPLKIEELS